MFKHVIKREGKQAVLFQAIYEHSSVRFRLPHAQLASEMKDQLRILSIKLSLKSTDISSQGSKGVSITRLF